MGRGVYWSASRIDVANYCRMRYQLRYIEKRKSLRLSVYTKGSLLHKLIEDFWKDLGSKDEVLGDKKNSKKKAKEKKKYYDQETFGKYAQGRWMKTVIADKNNGDPNKKISWRFDDEPYMVNAFLPKICYPLYDWLEDEGPPLAAELPFDFTLRNGMRFLGFIDEVRIRDGKVVVRDFKSGSPWLGDMKVHHDPQLTTYNAAICYMCYEDEEFAQKLGFSDIRHKFGGNPMYIHPEIIEEFFMIEALPMLEKINKPKPKREHYEVEIDFLRDLIEWENNKKKFKNPPKVLLETRRKDEHFLELIQMIEGAVVSVERGDVYAERGRKCDICDMKDACASTLDTVKAPESLQDKRGNLLFNFSRPPYWGPVKVDDHGGKEGEMLWSSVGRGVTEEEYNKRGEGTIEDKVGGKGVLDGETKKGNQTDSGNVQGTLNFRKSKVTKDYEKARKEEEDKDELIKKNEEIAAFGVPYGSYPTGKNYIGEGKELPEIEEKRKREEKRKDENEKLTQEFVLFEKKRRKSKRKKKKRDPNQRDLFET
jgi:hypothetical protein